MRLTHFQVYGEPTVQRTASGLGTFYAVRCGCGVRIPDGAGYFDSLHLASEAAYAHERDVAFGLSFDNETPVMAATACAELLRMAQDERIRDAVIRSVEAAHEDVRVTIAEWCERALVREIWRGLPVVAHTQSIEHVLGVLVATALDSPRQW